MREQHRFVGDHHLHIIPICKFVAPDTIGAITIVTVKAIIVHFDTIFRNMGAITDSIRALYALVGVVVLHAVLVQQRNITTKRGESNHEFTVSAVAIIATDRAVRMIYMLPYSLDLLAFLNRIITIVIKASFYALGMTCQDITPGSNRAYRSFIGDRHLANGTFWSRFTRLRPSPVQNMPNAPHAVVDTKYRYIFG
jgi:hypothetical protein